MIKSKLCIGVFGSVRRTMTTTSRTVHYVPLPKLSCHSINNHHHRFYSTTTVTRTSSQSTNNNINTKASPVLPLSSGGNKVIQGAQDTVERILSTFSRQDISDILRGILSRLKNSEEAQIQMEKVAKLDLQKETLLKWTCAHDLIHQFGYTNGLPDTLKQECLIQLGGRHQQQRKPYQQQQYQELADRMCVAMFRSHVGKLSHSDDTESSVSELTLLVNEINSYVIEKCFEGVVVNRVPRLSSKSEEENSENSESSSSSVASQFYSDQELRDLYVESLELMESDEMKSMIQKASESNAGTTMNAEAMLRAVRPIIFAAQLQILERKGQFTEMQQLIQEWVNFRVALDEWINRVCNQDEELSRVSRENQAKIFNVFTNQTRNRMKRARMLLMGVVLVSILIALGAVIL